jgi:hypothetical protein
MGSKGGVRRAGCIVLGGGPVSGVRGGFALQHSGPVLLPWAVCVYGVVVALLLGACTVDVPTWWSLVPC